MRLILRLSSPTRDTERTHIFTEAGGTIGRAENNSWVLRHPNVSNHHATISFSAGQFYLEDASGRGVLVNYVREVGDRPYALKIGDRLFIEPYEVEVAIENQTEGQDARQPDWRRRDVDDELAAAGLLAAQSNPELAGELRQIFRVVVEGLMDLLSSRRLIKDEFHIRQTAVRRPYNNPLKFSANADDALYNLLVKRNPAYLRGTHAFVDAFDDLRDHQLATLAAMRMAFEGMLADFDPDRMQEEFDRQIAKTSMPFLPARLRYWDLYREKRAEMMRDPDAAFIRLFGDEFARAYEEQIRELQARRHAAAAESANTRDDDVDRLKVLGTAAPVPFERAPVTPRVDVLLGGGYSPPGTVPAAEPPSATPDSSQIPEGYNPLAPDDPFGDVIVPGPSAVPRKPSPPPNPTRLPDEPTTRLDSGEPPDASPPPPAAAAPRPPAGGRATSKGREDPDLETELHKPYDAGSSTTPVRCSVFAPPSVVCGQSFLLQAFVHTRRQQRQVSSLAKLYDAHSEIRGATSLEHDLRRGTRLTFSVMLPGAQVDEPVQSLNWRGDEESVQFGITIPPKCAPGNLVGTVSVSEGSVPIGHVKFVLLVVAAGRIATAAQDSVPKQSWKRYRYAFISYASADRAEVLKRVQMLDRVSIECFQDLLSLEPGERWAQALYKHIDRSDVLFLFWSTAAKESEWVIKEVRYAIECHRGDDLAPPEIVPVLIEGPPPVAPPPELNDLHFNDRFLYFIASSA